MGIAVGMENGDGGRIVGAGIKIEGGEKPLSEFVGCGVNRPVHVSGLALM